MSNSEIRKIQITGGSTYIISLPKSWAKEAGLSAGSRVALSCQPDMSLLITPSEELKDDQGEDATDIHPSDGNGRASSSFSGL